MSDTKRILIAEDDTSSQLLLSGLLEYYKFQVTVVPDGKQALDVMQEQEFDALIIDLSMPEMNGWQLLQAIQIDEEKRDIPCIAITAFHSAEVAIKTLEAGFTAYFSKPIDVYTFEQELSALLP